MDPKGYAVFFIVALAPWGGIIVSAVDHPNVSSSSFCYDEPECGPSTWTGLCKTGKEQSPINIHLPSLQVFRNTEFSINENYLYDGRRRFFGQNNGHTAQFELNSNTSALRSNMKICGGHLGSCYKFAQFHYHWAEVDSQGSEHLVNFERFPMELHLVHYKDLYSSLADALSSNDREAVAVMAVFFKIGFNNNSALTPIMEALTELRVPGQVKEFDFPIDISRLFPRSAEFAHYNGSLTTPTCDEKVVWTVFLRPLEISESQIRQFRGLSNAEGNSDSNFRPFQPLHGRNVEFYRSLGFTVQNQYNKK